MRFCERCGNRQQEEWVTCPYCGMVNEAPSQPSEPFVPHTQVVTVAPTEETTETVAPTVASPVPPQPTKRSNEKKRFAWWKLLIVLELAVAVGLSAYAAVLGIMHASSSSSRNASSNKPTTATTAPTSSDENYGFDFDFGDEYDVDSDLDLDFDFDEPIVLDVSLADIGYFDEDGYVNPALGLRFETLDNFPVDYALMEDLGSKGIEALYAGVQEGRGNALVLFAEETTLTVEEYAEQYVNATAEQFGDASIVISDATVKALGGEKFLTYTMYIDGRVDFVGVMKYGDQAVVLDIYITNETQLQSVLNDIHPMLEAPAFDYDFDLDGDTFA